MSTGFGTRRKLSIAITVAVTVAAALGVWLLLNYVTTRPRLCTTFDLSRGARFVVSDATRAMIEQLREREQKLEIDTYYLSPRDGQLRPVAGIQRRVLELTKDLLRRLAYFGGDQVEVTDHNPYEAITSARAQEIGLETAGYNSVRLSLGSRERKLDLLTDLADIEIPEGGAAPRPGQIAQPVLRDYKGEEAIASALRGLLQEEELVAYWLGGARFSGADLRDPGAPGVSRLAREMRAHGFRNKQLDPTASIPADCKLLIIAGPEREFFSRDRREAFIGWLRRGGRALLTTHTVIDGLLNEQPSLRLLKQLGVEVGDRWVFNGVADPGDPQSFRDGEPECARVVVRGTGLSATHPVTERLRQQQGFVELHRARSLRLGSLPEGVSGQPFLSTNPKSWEVAIPEGTQRPSLGRPKPGETGPRHVGVSLEIAPAEVGGRKGRLVVIGGMAFRNGGDEYSLGRMAGRLFESNRTFGIYLANWLVREESLVTVSSRRQTSRTMTVALPQLERIRIALVWVLPALFLFLAFFVVFWRRRV